MSVELKRLTDLYEIFKIIDENSYLFLGDKVLSDNIKVSLDKDNELVYIIDKCEEKGVDYNRFRKFIIDTLISIEVLLDNIDLEKDYKTKVLKGNLSEDEYIKYAGIVCLARIKCEEISKILELN